MLVGLNNIRFLNLNFLSSQILSTLLRRIEVSFISNDYIYFIAPFVDEGHHITFKYFQKNSSTQSVSHKWIYLAVYCQKRKGL